MRWAWVYVKMTKKMLVSGSKVSRSFGHIIITHTDVSQPEAFHNRGRSRTDVAFNWDRQHERPRVTLSSDPPNPFLFLLLLLLPLHHHQKTNFNLESLSLSLSLSLVSSNGCLYICILYVWFLRNCSKVLIFCLLFYSL